MGKNCARFHFPLLQKILHFYARMYVQGREYVSKASSMSLVKPNVGQVPQLMNLRPYTAARKGFNCKACYSWRLQVHCYQMILLRRSPYT